MSFRFFRRTVPNALVFAALVGIAWWGHRSGWTLPKFAAMNGVAAKPSDDWCETHNVPESICVECDETLMPRPKSFGWCPTHGVQECPLDHPKVAQLATTYTVTEEDLERAKRAMDLVRPVNSRTCRLHLRRIQFASLAAVDKAGLEVDTPVTRAAIRESIPVYGEIAYDPALIAHLSSRSVGSVVKVFKHLGDRVEAGDILALVEANDVGKAKADFLQAAILIEVRQKALDHVRELKRIGVGEQTAVAVADAGLREAKLRFLSARQSIINLGLPRTPEDFKLLADESSKAIVESDLAKRLHFLGIPEAFRANFDRETTSSNLLPLRSPLGGVIVSKEIVAGEVVDTSRTLFEVIDASRVWLLLDVRAEDVSKIIVNQSKILFKPDGFRKDIEGVVSWISTDADAKTRTVKVRAELANPKGELRANTFGTGKIVLRDEPRAIVVPSSAVHWEGDCHVVFVRDKDWLKESSYKVLHTRVVRIAMRDDRITEIVAGLLPGEVVATKGSEILRAELLRANFGEGCGCGK